MTTINLYNGTHTGVFNEGTHRYKIDGIYQQGVTSVLNATLHKAALMLWPMNEALKTLGASWNNSDGWYLLGSDPITLKSTDFQRAASAYLRKRDKGADVGSGVHLQVEKFLRDIQLGEAGNFVVDAPDLIKPYNAFKKWFKANDIEVIGIEQIVFSEKFKYAGTYDSLLKINGKIYLCDLKTTNASKDTPDGIYDDYFIQLGAYYLAYKEERDYLIKSTGEMEKINAAMPEIEDLLIISCKKDGKLHTKSAMDKGLTPEQCAGAWRSCLELFNFRRKK